MVMSMGPHGNIVISATITFTLTSVASGTNVVTGTNFNNTATTTTTTTTSTTAITAIQVSAHNDHHYSGSSILQ